MKGTYCLIIGNYKTSSLKIGNLYEDHKFKKGFYVYIGSAMNSLVPRLNRHLSDEKKMHWHIDYLLKSPNCHIRDILFNISDKKIECDLAEIISKDGEEIPGFGCSDCSCSSHLIYFRVSAKTNFNFLILENCYFELQFVFNGLTFTEIN